MKIAFFEMNDWEIERIKESLPGHELIFFKEELNLDNCEKIIDADIISVFIYSQVRKEILAKLEKLKLISTRSTGFDHIDLQESKNRGITVTNVPSYGENTVAEHTFALILNLARNVHKSYLRTIRDDFTLDGLEGFDLKGKTIGIIGTGHIGLHVIRIAKGFGMNVIAFDPVQQRFVSEILGYEYKDLPSLLSSSDIISIHAPLNDKTYHMINKGNIGMIKKGCILINTSRGGLVDTDALMEGLDNGTLGGAGLDVIEGEELIKEEKQLLHDSVNAEKLRSVLKDHLIFKRDNVIFTPHNAFNSKEAKQRILNTTIENIISFPDSTKNRVV